MATEEASANDKHISSLLNAEYSWWIFFSLILRKMRKVVRIDHSEGLEYILGSVCYEALMINGKLRHFRINPKTSASRLFL